MMNLRNAYQKSVNDNWTLIDNHRKTTTSLVVAFFAVAYFMPLAIPAVAAFLFVSFFAQCTFNVLCRTTAKDITPLSRLSENEKRLEGCIEPFRRQVVGMTANNRNLRDDNIRLTDEKRALEVRIAALESQLQSEQNTLAETQQQLAEEKSAHRQLQIKMSEYAPYIAQRHNEILMDRQIRETSMAVTNAVTGTITEVTSSITGWFGENTRRHILSNTALTVGGGISPSSTN